MSACQTGEENHLLDSSVRAGSRRCVRLPFFFFNDTATTEIYTLSLHDALPISTYTRSSTAGPMKNSGPAKFHWRSEEHTSELQSRPHLVCRLLLEKKKKKRSKRPSNSSSRTEQIELTLSTTPHRTIVLPPTLLD